MKRLLLLLPLLLAGCVTDMLPNSPIQLGTGDLSILYGTLKINTSVSVANPFSTNKAPAVAVQPVPTPIIQPQPAQAAPSQSAQVVVTPAPVQPVPAPAKGIPAPPPLPAGTTYQYPKEIAP